MDGAEVGSNKEGWRCGRRRGSSRAAGHGRKLGEEETEKAIFFRLSRWKGNKKNREQKLIITNSKRKEE